MRYLINEVDKHIGINAIYDTALKKEKSENEAKDKRFQFSIGISWTTSTECSK